MGYRNISFASHEFYHVYNRGNSKQVIFKDKADYVRFQDLLYLANTTESISVRNARRKGIYEEVQNEPLVAVGAYCLMPNHFHILLTPLVQNGVSEFMRKLGTGYSMYFNKRHERTGSLFEGKFKSTHVVEDQYFKYLFSYIHLNPLKLKSIDWKTRLTQDEALLKSAREYHFSSLQDYLFVVRNESMILSKEHFPSYFVDKKSWESEMREWIGYDDAI